MGNSIDVSGGTADMPGLKPEETELQGYWLDTGSAVTPDANWDRIQRLTDGYLELLAVVSDGREQLYRDPADGRLWELVPVAPHIPAGPPLLRVIPPTAAAEKYAVSLT
jgi:hypothetical protein